MPDNEVNTADERRRHPRFKVGSYLSLQTISPSFEGRRSKEIRDLSISGLKFESNKTDKVETGEIISSRIFINDRNYHPIELKVIRKDRDGIACEFLNQSETDHKMLYHFLEFTKLCLQQAHSE